MPALLVDTSTTTTTSSTSPSASSPSLSSSTTPPAHPPKTQSRSRSPDRPPVSPITPTDTDTIPRLAPSDNIAPSAPSPPPPPVATFRQQPSSVPIHESENPDAIALRSAISLLQLQREKSKRDLKALEQLRQQAVADPKAFALSLQTQRANAPPSQSDILAPTLSDISNDARKELHQSESSPRANDQEEDDEDPGTNSVTEAPRFPSIPQPQNVVRCPPVNWAKYHVIGESLDKMHEEQKRYPNSTDPLRSHQGKKQAPHAVAAPYSPFTDSLSQPQAPQQSWRSTKKSPS
ncbi:unnamed protein product [Periconia digitata]|uniref:Uncharacterized protein n=1 Tax=Periconia digitata TaxID=1303443 RepID=A0A9W4U9I0_9PLEO|nr:unnamed protein product [Periconia digitata]